MGLVTHDPRDPSDFRDPFDPWLMTHRPIPCSGDETAAVRPLSNYLSTCCCCYHLQCFKLYVAVVAIFTARSELQRFCFWRRQSVGFLFVHEISREPLNGFAPNSHRIRVLRTWSLARTSLKVKVKDQRSRSLGQKTAFVGPFGGLRAVYVHWNIFSL